MSNALLDVKVFVENSPPQFWPSTGKFLGSDSVEMTET